MMDLYQEIVNCHTEGKPFAFAMIVKTIGSVPRDVGAKMMVFPDGSIAGTIGGGNFEKMVIDECVELLKGEKIHLLKTYRLEESGPDSTGMYCGGEVEVFIEVNPRPDKLIIFGGGHICRDLVKVAAGLNFKIIVVDERPDILTQYQKPVETILTDENFNDNYPAIDKNSYIVIVTHGHRCDKQALANVINKDWAYIGMIGSRNKIIKTFAELESAGIKKSLLEKVHAPVGLDISAEGPYEIAVAIAAELIAVKRKKSS